MEMSGRDTNGEFHMYETYFLSLHNSYVVSRTICIHGILFRNEIL